MSRCFALIPAAGIGARMQGALPKQYLSLLGETILYSSIATLLSEPRIVRVFVVLSPNDTHFQRYDWSIFGKRLHPLRCGGKTRAESVHAGLDHIQTECADDDWILVHDAVRPCLPFSALTRLLDQLMDEPIGGLLATPVKDTLKRVSDDLRVIDTLPREHLWQAQTPQMFRYGLLKQALSEYRGVTDEAGAVEMLGYSPKIVPGDVRNLKITYPEDLKLAEVILKMPAQQPPLSS